jgi:hypothetical protein
LFHAPVVKAAVADQDRTNAVLRKSCESRFETAIGIGIHNKELQAERSRRRLQVWDDRLGNRSGRVRENGPDRVSSLAAPEGPRASRL